MVTYYVRKTGNDTTGDGSTVNPWLTFAKANSVVVTGDTVNFGDGVYQENISSTGYLYILNKLYASTVTYQAENGAAGDVTFQCLTSTTYNVFLNNCTHITFKWIRFVSRVSNNYSALDFKNYNMSYIAFEDCIFTCISSSGAVNSSFQSGTQAGYAHSNITFTRCTFNQIGSDNVDGFKYLSADAATPISGLSLIDCNLTATRTGYYIRGTSDLVMQNCSATTTAAGGVACKVGEDADSSVYTTAGMIDNCTFESKLSHSFLIGAGCEDFVATNCTVHGGDYGIVIKENTNTDVEYCTVFGGSVSGIYCKAAIDPIVTHNHITNYRASLFKVDKSTVNKCLGVTCEHNMLVATGTAGCLEWAGDTGDAGGGVCDYNKYGPRGSGLLGSVRADASVANLSELRAAWAGYGDGSNDSHSTLIQNKSSLMLVKR
jgi:Right handed beta helix region